MKANSNKLRYLSLFSGIEAASVAWEPLGWEPVAFAEFAPFQKAVLRYRFPGVPDLGDVTKITEEQVRALGHIDLVVGGSPCQDLSIAGQRAGLRNDDGSVTRSGLFDEEMRIFEIARRCNDARFLLWENVPGSFSSNGGKDFAYILGSMVGREVPLPDGGKWRSGGACVSSDGRRVVEWRVLDAQYFGVPQRRRRVFALLDTGAWGGRPPILLEPESVCGSAAQGGRKGQGASAGAAECSGGEGCRTGCGTVSLQLGQTGGNGSGFNTGNASYTLDRTAEFAVGYKERDVQFYESHPNDSRVTAVKGEVAPTVSSRYGTGGNNTPIIREAVCLNDQGGSVMSVTVGKTATLRSQEHGHQPLVLQPHDPKVVCMASTQANAEIASDKSPTITLLHEQPIVVYKDE